MGFAGGSAERQPEAPLLIPEVAALPGRYTDGRPVAINGGNGRDVAKKLFYS